MLEIKMFRITLVAMLLLFSSQIMAEKIYKWVDEDGQIHYSSKKPDNQEVETVKVRKGPKVKAKVTAVTDNTTENAAEAGEQNTAQTDAVAEAAAKQKLAAADKVNRKKQCDMARNNYSALNATVRVLRTNEKGEKVRMSDDERVKALATAQKGIDQYCN